MSTIVSYLTLEHGFFLTKWATLEPNFVQYFETYWLSRNSNWFAGAHFRTPDTNNALENFNGNFKKYQTEYRKMGLAEFKIRLLNMVKQRSQSYLKDTSPFQGDINISNNVLKSGLQYSKTKKMHVIESEDKTKVHCYMLQGDNTAEVNAVDVNAFIHATYATFEDFSENLFKYYIITFENDSSADWKKSASCTCAAFADKFICKHVIAVAYKSKRLKEKTHLNPNTKPGRPKKGTGALTRDE